MNQTQIRIVVQNMDQDLLGSIRAEVLIEFAQRCRDMAKASVWGLWSIKKRGLIVAAEEAEGCAREIMEEKQS